MEDEQTFRCKDFEELKHYQQPSWRINLISQDSAEMLFCVALPLEYKKDNVVKYNCLLINQPCTKSKLTVCSFSTQCTWNLSSHKITSQISELDPSFQPLALAIVRRIKEEHYLDPANVSDSYRVWCFKFIFQLNRSVYNYISSIKRKISTNNKKLIDNINDCKQMIMTRQQCWQYVTMDINAKNFKHGDCDYSYNNDTKPGHFEMNFFVEFNVNQEKGFSRDRFEYKRNNIFIGFTTILSNYHLIRNLISKELSFISDIVNIVFEYIPFHHLKFQSAKSINNQNSTNRKYKKKHLNYNLNVLDIYGSSLTNDKYLCKLNEWCCGIPQSILNSCHKQYKLRVFPGCVKTCKCTISWYECCLMDKDCMTIENDFVWIDTSQYSYDTVDCSLTPRGIHGQRNTRKSQRVEEKNRVGMPFIDVKVENHCLNNWRLYMKHRYGYLFRKYDDCNSCRQYNQWSRLDKSMWLLNRVAFATKILNLKKCNEKFYNSVVETLLNTPTLQYYEKKRKDRKRKQWEEYAQYVHYYQNGRDCVLSHPNSNFVKSKR